MKGGLKSKENVHADTDIEFSDRKYCDMTLEQMSSEMRYKQAVRSQIIAFKAVTK